MQTDTKTMAYMNWWGIKRTACSVWSQYCWISAYVTNTPPVCNTTIPAGLNLSGVLICASDYKQPHTNLPGSYTNNCVFACKPAAYNWLPIRRISIWFCGLQTMVSRFCEERDCGTRCINSALTSQDVYSLYSKASFPCHRSLFNL